jgi:hypothetical protein
MNTTRVRSTMPLSAPYRTTKASLSFDAALALAYGLKAISTASPQRPRESSITRRALVLYASSLSDMTAEQLRTEGRAVAASSSAFGLPEDEQREAFERLDAVAVGLPLPGLLAVRNGPAWQPMDAHALAAKVDSVVSDIYRDRLAQQEVQP